MRKLETYHTFGRFANEPALRLADRLVAIGPIPGAKVMLTSGGSDSVDLACKLARRHWQLEGRPERRSSSAGIGAYHGLHAFGTSIAGLPYNRDGYGTDVAGPGDRADLHQRHRPRSARPLGRLGPDNVAAIIAEPVIGTGGVIGPADGLPAGPGGLCPRPRHPVDRRRGDHRLRPRRSDVRLAALRTSHPDLITMAKGITSGYAPLGGVLVAPRVSDRFFAGRRRDAPIFRHGLTYSGHATACVVAEANLDVIEEEGLVERSG